MSDYDLIVLGAGPAGAAAAIKARSLGLRVAVIDEAQAAGGQVYRAPSPALTATLPDADRTKGDQLRAKLAASGAVLYANHRAWSLTPGFSVIAIGPDGPLTLEAPNLIVAAGAVERHIPVTGWTLPGVIGLAGATILLKAHGVLPGRRVVVAGSGPLLLLVASKIVAAGGEVAAVVDAAPRSGWLVRAGAMLARPDLMAKGAGWLLALLKARVPIHSGSAIRRVHGTDGIEAVTIGPVDRDWRPVGNAERTVRADAVCLGYGLLPATEVTRLLGAEHRYEPELGGWVPAVDASLQTSVPGLFVAGDGAGVRGADAAPLSGELAALGVISRLGLGSDLASEAGKIEAAWHRSARFGAAMSALAMPPPGAAEMIAAGTTVCRCEGLARATLDAAIATGARTLADLKAMTRCGMGPCGGRVCGEAAAMLIGAATGWDRATIGQPSARPPLRSVPLAAITGAFDYDDLPIPAPAPL
ncbi:Thioredoxin reductase [Bosea sp. 62]|uniref:FAD/NAD(P)-dependent oxidoreductase n=1 Tax=unclassified Bosea (in: a-proteobacteria) TaxID=2653178 RepID=UPI001255DEB3|nr:MULTISPECIES: FAD-dependent oxidoreductase [unclassified Bosea (in: a-proteobacteria)]CAD5248952.1 Thioredoxin reductase [Bosea sp. 46]CAD5250037.1 Thioredoxin reductase [Bosea sp. 21B]CAD5265816.1 Thioredoxin reductase [Bosea sp. 7B]VVT44628.1 Thioredoxin reductase [Bosea sp. EC-HK365B]VXB06124.1 Thioredoxin reductase [Bosea sp. 29B]